MPLTIQEFKHKLMLRVLLSKVRRGTNPSYAEIYSNAFYALNEILREQGLNGEVWAIRRGQRLYLLHAKCKRIICEIGVSAEPVADFFVITLRGVVPSTTTLESLVQMTAKRGTRRNTLKFIRKDNYEQDHQRHAR